MEVIEIVTRTGLVREPPVNSHVLLVHLADQGLVALPQKGLDPIPAANIHQKVDQGGQGLVRHLVGVLRVGRDFDRDRAVVVGAGRTAPGPVLFLHGQADRTVLPDDVVRGTLAAGGGEVVTALLRRPLSDNTMNRDGVDLMIPGAGPVRADPGIRH